MMTVPQTVEVGELYDVELADQNQEVQSSNGWCTSFTCWICGGYWYGVINWLFYVHLLFALCGAILFVIGTFLPNLWLQAAGATIMFVILLLAVLVSSRSDSCLARKYEKLLQRKRARGYWLPKLYNMSRKELKVRMTIRMKCGMSVPQVVEMWGIEQNEWDDILAHAK